MPGLNSLNDLLIDELKDLHSAERQLVAALPKMAAAASNRALKKAFRSHLAETKTHVRRVEKSLKLLRASAKPKTCHAMQGLVREGAEAISTPAPAAVRDANLIGAAQRVEHYEMAAYGCARAFAVKLARDDIAELLQLTLDQEGAANKQLTELATIVNDDAFSVTNSRPEIMPSSVLPMTL